MKLLKLTEARIQIGAALPWNIRSASGMLLLARGQVIHDKLQVDHLLERGASVELQEARAVLAQGHPCSQPRARPPNGLFEDWAQMAQRVETLIKGMGRDTAFVAHVRSLAGDIAQLMDRDPDVAIYLILRQENVQFFNYGYTHAVHVAVTCVLVARQMGWADEQVMRLTEAALTMNVAIAALQGRIATQDFELQEKQRLALLAHPQAGVAMLREAGVTDQAWLDAVARHHEHADGSGYPGGLREISPMARVLRHADAFAAKISPRNIRQALTAQEAERELFREDHAGEISTALIKAFGIHPPGDMVRLASGEIALVMRRSVNARTPLAASITDRRGTPVPHTLQRNTAEPDHAIVGGITDKKLLAMMRHVPPQRFYGLMT